MTPFVRGTRAARRRTRASAATAASASPSCSRSRGASAPRGSRPATTRGSSSATDSCCSRAPPTRRRIRATCWRDSTRAGSRRIWFPLGDQTKTETRAEAAAAGLAAAQSCREPGGVLPRRRRLPRRSSSGTGSQPRRARSSTRTASTLGAHDGFWRFTPGQRRGLGVAPPSRCTRSRPTRARTRSWSGRARPLARTARARSRGRLFAPAGRVRRSSATARPPWRPTSTQTASGFKLRARRAGLRRRPGPGGRALRRRRGRRFRVGHVRSGRLG